MGEVWAIVVAGGSGTRLGGDVPKQFLEFGGRRLIDWALAAAAACDGVVAVLPAAHLDAVPALSPPGAPSSRPDAAGSGPSGSTPGAAVSGAGEQGRACDGRPLRVVAGGATRSESVRAGLAAVPDGAAIVVVHDAARPLAGPALFERVVAAVRAGADGAVPGVAVADTVKRVDPAGAVVETLDRAALRTIQTPQAFAAAVLRAAHARGGEATDDAALVEALGATVVVVDGDPSNLKITAPEDLVRAEVLLDRREL